MVKENFINYHHKKMLEKKNYVQTTPKQEPNVKKMERGKKKKKDLQVKKDNLLPN